MPPNYGQFAGHWDGAFADGAGSAIIRPLAPIAQLDRVLGYEPRGREFESLWARHSFKGLPLGKPFVFSACAVNVPLFESIPPRKATSRSACGARCSAARCAYRLTISELSHPPILPSSHPPIPPSPALQRAACLAARARSPRCAEGHASESPRSRHARAPGTRPSY